MSKLQKLWGEKKQIDDYFLNNGCQQHVLHSKESDSIAKAILSTSEECSGSDLTAEESEAVEWAKRRLGI